MIDSKRINEVEFLHECLSVDAENGTLTWKVRPQSHFKNKNDMNAWNGHRSGKNVGCFAAHSKNKGYMVFSLLGKHCNNHRIIFFMHHGFLPDYVDHIDGDTLNNKIGNLRAATMSQNLMNASLSVMNTSGVKGVSWIKKYGKWHASCKANGKTKSVGYFDDITLAEKAVMEYRIKLHGEFANHGNGSVLLQNGVTP